MYATITSEGVEGYRCVSHSPDLQTTIIHKLEQLGLPFGGSWASYIGARSIKIFPVSRIYMAISYTMVTDKQDDEGRSGILLSHCIIETHKYLRHLIYQPNFAFDDIFRNPKSSDELIELLPRGSKYKWRHYSQIPKDTRLEVVKGMLRIYSNRKLMLKYPYKDPLQWQIVEYTFQSILTYLPSILFRYLSFTTFSLSTAEPSSVFAMPEHVAS